MTQVISQFPAAPDSQHDSQTEFNTKADAFVHHQADTYVTEVNTWKDQANTLEGELNTIKTAVDQIVGTIPTGSIDDSVTNSTKVWSSQKVSNELALKPDMPTTGSNTDGYWVKYPDGTMIQYGKFNNSNWINVAKGNIWRSAYQAVSFPEPFIDENIGLSSSSDAATWSSSALNNKNGFGNYVFGAVKKESATVVWWQATGRWK